MKKPKKPKKPKKNPDPIDEYIHFEVTLYEDTSEGIGLKDYILLSEDEVFKENLRLAEHFAREEGVDMEEILDTSHPFGDVYCCPYSYEGLSEGDIDLIKSLLPKGYANLRFHSGGRWDESSPYITYDLKKSDEQIAAEEKYVAERFKRYEEELKKYEEELKKYEDFKRQERISKMEKELAELKSS